MNILVEALENMLADLLIMNMLAESHLNMMTDALTKRIDQVTGGHVGPITSKHTG